jgi:hypothetical protein
MKKTMNDWKIFGKDPMELVLYMGFASIIIGAILLLILCLYVLWIVAWPLALAVILLLVGVGLVILAGGM